VLRFIAFSILGMHLRSVEQLYVGRQLGDLFFHEADYLSGGF
jgi:hypothetical protein